MLGHASLFCRLHSAQQRYLTGLIAVHANTQIDFVRTGIGIECFVQAKDGVTRGQFYRGKQTHDMGKLDIQVNVGCRAMPVLGIERAGRREVRYSANRVDQ